ncbi:MAG TPA: hypothetical protein VIP09_00970 [Dehalococcoidia bacterium]
MEISAGASASQDLVAKDASGGGAQGDGVQLSWRPVVFKVEQIVMAGSLP